MPWGIKISELLPKFVQGAKLYAQDLVDLANATNNEVRQKQTFPIKDFQGRDSGMKISFLQTGSVFKFWMEGFPKISHYISHQYSEYKTYEDAEKTILDFQDSHESFQMRWNFYGTETDKNEIKQELLDFQNSQSNPWAQQYGLGSIGKHKIMLISPEDMPELLHYQGSPEYYRLLQCYDWDPSVDGPEQMYDLQGVIIKVSQDGVELVLDSLELGVEVNWYKDDEFNGSKLPGLEQYYEDNSSSDEYYEQVDLHMEYHDVFDVSELLPESYNDFTAFASSFFVVLDPESPE